MPKKFPSENPKAAAARVRKQEAKDVEHKQKQKAEEDSYWQDDDKKLQKKQQKKDGLEAKRQEQLARKAEQKELLDAELNAITAVTKKKSAPVVLPKVTRSEIALARETALAEQAVQATAKSSRTSNVVVLDEEPLEENLNRLTVDGDEARTVDEAIAILESAGGVTGTEDKHPEKRMKAAYNAYYKTRVAQLKAEKPSLRLSQLKEMIFKEWQTAPENPRNNDM